MSDRISAPRGAMRISASVRRYDPAKGYGILEPLDGSPDLLCREPALGAVGLPRVLCRQESGAALHIVRSSQPGGQPVPAVRREILLPLGSFPGHPGLAYDLDRGRSGDRPRARPVRRRGRRIPLPRLREARQGPGGGDFGCQSDGAHDRMGLTRHPGRSRCASRPAASQLAFSASEGLSSTVSRITAPTIKKGIAVAMPQRWPVAFSGSGT